MREAWGNEIFVGANFIVGLPGETKESIQETFEWLHQPDVPLHAINVSRLYIAQYPTTIKTPDLVTDEQMRNYGFLKNINGWQYTNTSKMQDNPENYDLEYGEDMWWQWTSKYMTAEEADDIATKFYEDPRNQHLKMNFTYPYSRLINIGYKKEDILQMDQTQRPLLKQLMEDTRKLKKCYIDKLCTLPVTALARRPVIV